MVLIKTDILGGPRWRIFWSGEGSLRFAPALATVRECELLVSTFRFLGHGTVERFLFDRAILFLDVIRCSLECNDYRCCYCLFIDKVAMLFSRFL